MHRRATTLATPRAESWDDAWLNCVDESEQRLGRPICGAHAPDGEPCELGSTHPNGRCRFHGGHPRIGAQPGNTNALIHGLYSRRLRQCNNTCPVWHMCPFAGPDVTALSERKRPVCAYEREAYAIAMGIPDMKWSAAATPDIAVADDETPFSDPDLSDTEIFKRELKPALGGAGTGGPPPFGSLPENLFDTGETARENLVTQLRYRATPFFGKRGATTRFPRTEIDDRHCEEGAPFSARRGNLVQPETPRELPDPTPGMIEDTGAILYAMLQRATLTVSAHHLTEKTEADGERYSLRSTKMSAALTAFLRIGRELRAWLRLRPAAADSAGSANGFGDNVERPEFTTEGYQQFYDHKGNIIGLASLMHPFLHELDAAVEQLRQEGITVAPPKGVTT